MKKDKRFSHQWLCPGRFVGSMWLAFSSGVFWLVFPLCSPHAQTPITPSGLNTQVNLSQTPPTGKVQYDITGGTRPGSGSNLFHSFGEFGVPTNNIANFVNETALPTSNILGRVTGGNPSNIFGTLQTTGFGNANLFLMNPAGIVFGPNASLNVGGSVSFTTADYLRLVDGAKFNAIPGSQDASISSAPVAAFGFLGSNPAAIVVQGSQLNVPAGAELSLIGGNITIQSSTLENATTQPAQLSAPGGKISLASVASAGEILAGSLEQTANVNGQSFGSLGAIQIAEKSLIDVSGDGGGTVVIRGGRFVINDSLISANVTGPDAGSPGTGIDIIVSQEAVIKNGSLLDTTVSGNASPDVQYGGVSVKADRIEILGSEDLENSPVTGIFSNVGADSTGGNSGDIALESNSILVKDLGTFSTLLAAETSGAGNSGSITLKTIQNMEIGAAILTSTNAFEPLSSVGNAGNIQMTSSQGNVILNGSFVSSQSGLSSNGRVGSIAVKAPNGDILLAGNEFAPSTLFTSLDGTGANAGMGGIQLTAKNLTIENSGIQIDNFTIFQPGSLTVNLIGRLSMSGLDFPSTLLTTTRRTARSADLNITAHDILFTNGSAVSTETFRNGDGGTLDIFTTNLQITNGAQVTSNSRFDPFSPEDLPSGAAGTITIQGTNSSANAVLIDGPGSGIFTNTEGTGHGGTTTLSAQSLTIQNGGTISASTSGSVSSATGGSITVNTTDRVTMTDGASITASSTGPADAGNIAINAGAQFLSQNASVTTEASQASGGNILIQATDSIRLINSQINTSVQGGPNTSGGNITIDPAIMTLQNSQILAQAVQGQGGNINIVAGTFLADPTSVVSASSQFGLSGAVNIQSPLSNLSGSLATLPQRPLQVQHLLQQRCAAQANGQLSSLVVTGRDTLPSEPGGWLMSSIALLSEDVPVSQPNPLTSDDLIPSPQKMIVSGQLYERHTPSSQQGVTSWAAGCGS